MVCNVRQERGSKRLEEESNSDGQARQVTAQTRAQSQQTSEQRASSEEQRNQVEGEHEPREVKVHVCPDKLLRHALGGAKVARRVEGQRGHNGAAVRVVARGGVAAADGEEGPSRGVARVADAVCGGLQEVELVDGGGVDGAGEDGEELHYDASGDEEERAQGEDGFCLGMVSAMFGWWMLSGECGV